MKNLQFVGIIAFLCFGLVACGDDTSGDADSGMSADAGPVSFASDVLPILQANSCVGCHGGNGGFTIGTDPSASMIDVGGTPGISSGCETAASVRVSPGNAEGSILFLRIDGRCEEQMPRGLTPLTSAEINTVRDWINQGANP